MQSFDLRSDTVTRPTEAMRDAIRNAEMGDDVFGEDPTVNRLEKRLAADFGMEQGLYCSSGTMANQIAIKAHTSPGDQVICSWAAHIYNYEGGGIASNSGVTAKLLEGNRGFFKADQVAEAIHVDDFHYPISRLVSIEDTSNKGGGATWPLGDIAEISSLCRERGLAIHCDGARLYNRLVAKGDSTQDYGQHFDSISICLSKGLGAPVGSVLIGNSDFIKRARRIRKAFGGGMRQAGLIAAAGLYALDNNVERLADDHVHARTLAKALEETSWVENILPVETNIILFNLKEAYVAEDMVSKLAEHGVLCFPTGPRSIRFVVHLDIAAADVAQICQIIKAIH